MDKSISFALIGNDPRLYWCGERLRSRGIRAAQYPDGSIPDVFCYLFAPPFSAAKAMDTAFAKKGATVFVGAADDESKKLITSRGAVLIDYCECEFFASENARLTAEAAITVYIGAASASLKGAKALVSGFGRIGKSLALLLKAHGSDVTVSARKTADIELIRAYGCTPVETAGIRGDYDVVFNTVPAHIFTRDVIDRTTAGYYIELASAPYGTEDARVWGVGTKVIKASGLPGKVMPVSAGRLIADTVCTLLKEARI